jgi:UDP-N-acetylmuramate dehydrogenase
LKSSEIKIEGSKPRNLNSLASAFSSIPDVEFKWHEPLANHTTFKVGGPVSCLARPQTENSFVDLMRRIRNEDIPHIILGEGSNILAPDSPWDAVAIQLHHSCASIRIHEESGKRVKVYVGSGVRVARCLRFCLRNQLNGMEFLVGIPGTIGGALVMNAGTDKGCMADPLIWADCLDTGGNRHRILKSELKGQYRSMGFPQGWTVLGSCFHLRPASVQDLKKTLRELMKKRKSTQPLGQASAGCVFKNPPGCSAGALIERSGLKGTCIGDAQVSEKHANWIINRGNAKARDIVALMQIIEDEVLARFNVCLEREIQVLES